MGILLWRLSSFGDLVMTGQALRAVARDRDAAAGPLRVEWVVKAEFAPVVVAMRDAWVRDDRGDGASGGAAARPALVLDVIPVPGSARGLRGWVCWVRGFARGRRARVSVDAHRVLRTGLARWIAPTFRWSRLPKERLRTAGYCLLRDAWPRTWRPRPYEARVRATLKRALALGGEAGPDRARANTASPRRPADGRPASRPLRIGVAPGAAWPGKVCPAGRLAEGVRGFLAESASPAAEAEGTAEVVVFGRREDAAIEDFLAALGPATRGYRAAWAGGALAEQLRAVETLDLMVAMDSGFAHWAGARGVPVAVIYGPTTPGLGFAVDGAEVEAVGGDLWCRPCGKDGSRCFRQGEDRWKCLRTLDPSAITAALRKLRERMASRTGA